MHQAGFGLFVLVAAVLSQLTSTQARAPVSALGVQLRDLRSGYRLVRASTDVYTAAEMARQWSWGRSSCAGCITAYAAEYQRGPTHSFNPKVSSSTLHFGTTAAAHSFYADVAWHAWKAGLAPHHTFWCGGMHQVSTSVGNERIGWHADMCEGGGPEAELVFRRGRYVQFIALLVPYYVANRTQVARDSILWLSASVDQHIRTRG